jgi:hypothetical protein
LRIAAGALVRTLLLTLVCVPAALVAKEKPPVQYRIPVPTLPDFSAFDWIQGQWEGKTAPGSPPGDVQLSIEPDLNKHFLVLREKIFLAATPTVPATDEAWMGMLSAGTQPNGFVLRVYSSTGFIVRYQVTVDAPEIRLNPEGGDAPPPGWLFRMVWARTGPEEVTQRVQAAPPGKRFFDYYTVKLARVPPAVKEAPAAEPKK